MKKEVLTIGNRRFLRITKKRVEELLKINEEHFSKILFYNKGTNKYYIETQNNNMNI